ncbi:MAG: Fis family transcriptional regulator [Alphaproteobacteria bacterium]|nr:MAG: Fis family transcriptional regulator [Alphaproteobacteria bacterium]
MKHKNLPNILKDYLSEFLEDNHEHVSDLHRICVSEIERLLIEATMQNTDGNQVQAAKILGLNRNTLRRKIIEYNIKIKVSKAS